MLAGERLAYNERQCFTHFYYIIGTGPCILIRLERTWRTGGSRVTSQVDSNGNIYVKEYDINSNIISCDAL